MKSLLCVLNLVYIKIPRRSRLTAKGIEFIRVTSGQIDPKSAKKKGLPEQSLFCVFPVF